MTEYKTITLTAPFPDVTIRVDDKGRWSLTDIHKQLIGGRACEPGQWCRSADTAWYIEDIESRGIDFRPVSSTRGVGCWALPELAVIYLMDALPNVNRTQALAMHKYLSEKYSGPTGRCEPFVISTLELAALLGVPHQDLAQACKSVKEEMEAKGQCSYYAGDDRLTSEEAPEPHYLVGWLIAWPAATALARTIEDPAQFQRAFHGVLALENKVRAHYVSQGFSNRRTPGTLSDHSGSLELGVTRH